MTTDQKPDTAYPGEADVVRYLLENPDFFERHNDVLAQLTLLHESGRAISLIERQVELLRAENRNLERKLMNLVQVARDNERLGGRIQKLALAVVESESLTELLAAFEEMLAKEFNAEYIVLRLIQPSDGLRAELPEHYCVAAEDELPKLFKGFLRKRRVSCGRLVGRQMTTLFAEAATNTASAALIPLFGGREYGLLALGSSDPDRFQPAMGVMFLEQIGELLSAALSARMGDY